MKAAPHRAGDAAPEVTPVVRDLGPRAPWRHALAACIVVVAAGCASGTGAVRVDVRTADGSRTEVELRAGQELVLELESNPTTGYEWAIVDPPDPAVLRPAGTDYVPDRPVNDGSGGRHDWRFDAVGPGVTAMTLQYSFPGLDGPEVAATCHVEVEVEPR